MRKIGSVFISIVIPLVFLLILNWAVNHKANPALASTLYINENLPGKHSTPGRTNHALGLQKSSSSILLVPDSTNKRVMAFDALSGDLVDANYVPPDPAHMDMPLNALLSANGDSILVSDYNAHVIWEYGLSGAFVGVFAPAGGPNPSQLQYPRGMALSPSGNLLVTMSANPEIDIVVEFNTTGNYVGIFISNGAGGMDSPYDILRRESDWLVGGANSDAIHRYNLNGQFLGNLALVDNFPQQLAQTSGANILIADFSGAEAGILEYTSDGTFVGRYSPFTSGYRGVYELPNGNLLISAGTAPGGVYEISRDGSIIDTKIITGTPRYIEFAQIGPPVTPTISLSKSVVLAGDVCPGLPSLTVPAFSAVTYCYQVENSGSVSLSTHSLVDDQLGTILSNTFQLLLPGEHYVVTATATISQPVTNHATWTASTVAGLQAISNDQADVAVSPTIYVPLLRNAHPAPEN